MTNKTPTFVHGFINFMLYILQSTFSMCVPHNVRTVHGTVNVGIGSDKWPVIILCICSHSIFQDNG